MPFWSLLDKEKAVPDRVTMDGGMGFWRSISVIALIGFLTVVPLKAVGELCISVWINTL